ncbi:MAG TPA: hypothetical protein VGB37_03775 [Candidatus Lokiarchaeia archaeon]
MLISLFIFQSEKGSLLYDKLFQEMDDEKLEIFSGFFSALKTFIFGMKFDASKELKTIDLGEYFLNINHILDLSLDLVLVSDKPEDKPIGKITPQIIDIIVKYKPLFLESENQPVQFKSFDEEIINLIVTNKKIIDESLIDDKSVIFKSIWSQKGEISSKLRDELSASKTLLLSRLNDVSIVPEKLKIYEKLIDITEKLNKKEENNKYLKEAGKLNEELSDRKIRLKYYLDTSKDALRAKNYKEAYLNLLNFCLKLKNYAKTNVINKYQTFTNLLVDKDAPKIEFSKAISEILMIPDNIDDYFL